MAGLELGDVAIPHRIETVPQPMQLHHRVFQLIVEEPIRVLGSQYLCRLTEGLDRLNL